MNDQKNLAQHILPVSSNLLGLCFLIFSFIKVSDLGKATLLDECIVAPTILFFISSFLSYASIRSGTNRYERHADKIFIAGLCLLALISLTFIFENF